MRERTTGTIFLASLLAAACSGGGGPQRPDDNFDRGALLENLGENVVLPAVTGFAEEAAALEDAVVARCDALGGEAEGEALGAAREAWRTAMDRWQEAEMMQFGPAAMNSGDLRDRIYSFDVVASCPVDQDVKLHFDDPDAYDIQARTTNRRGLDALEYLLFTESLDHTCPPQSAPEGWDALSDADKAKARCDFAAVAAADVVASAGELAGAWDPAAGDYLGVLVAAGGSGSSFSTAHEAVNEISSGMFYVDTFTKDMKLAEPAGIAANTCGTVQEPCPAELESQHARRSKEHIAANLRAFERLFSGADGVGFDDFLVELGAPDLAERMEASIAGAITAVDAIPGTLSEALASDYEKVAAAHTAVKAITDDLKSQFLTVLGLELPDNGPADND